MFMEEEIREDMSAEEEMRSSKASAWLTDSVLSPVFLAINSLLNILSK